ncbi:hypothetical protein EDD72_1331, partial [Tepidibacillus fermentans]
GIVALAHNILKVAGIRLDTFLESIGIKKQAGKKRKVFHQLVYYFRDFLDSPFFWFVIQTCFKSVIYKVNDQENN